MPHKEENVLHGQLETTSAGNAGKSLAVTLMNRPLHCSLPPVSKLP